MHFDDEPGQQEWGSGAPDGFLGVGAAAKLAGVSVDTIRRWCTNGRLPYRQGGPNNHRRILRSDLLRLLAGEGTEPTIRRGGGRRRLQNILEEWTEEIEDLLPWRPGPLDSEDRIGRTLVSLRGYSADNGRGGLIGRLLNLVDDLEAALPSTPDFPEVDGHDDGLLDNDERDSEPHYLQVLRAAARDSSP